MKQKAMYVDGNLIGEVYVANSFWTRFRGLMLKKEKSIEKMGGLWIKPCSQIHTFFMKAEIDVVYLDKTGVIIKNDRAVARGICCKAVKGAGSVLEFPAGSIDKWQIHIGDKVEVV